MSYEQRQQVLEQLPQGAVITKIYRGFEDNELRVIVKLPDEDWETRYAVKFGDDSYPHIKLKP